jgi:TonB-linked SusC/RagA family outer membrane protein
MYKIFTGFICGGTSCALSNFLRVMKLTIVLWVVALMQVSASTYAQKTSLNVKNKPLIDVLDQITRQTNYNFIYSSDILNTAKPVSISVKDAELNDVLEKCFFNQPFTFLINGNTVIIKRKAEVVKVSAEQATPIKGTVKDDKGAPLPGASVIIKGTAKGIITNNNGEFSIDAKAGDILVISFIGFENKEIVIGSQSTIEVRMTAVTSTLNELVVIGYGTQKKATLTGAISSVSADDMKGQQITRADDALQGRAAGVVVTQNSGAPGASPSVIIRGVNSLTNSSPLYVIDGQIWDNGGYDSVNPNDIESIQVLKDASAGIYGSRSANGVILITTKKGKPGTPKLNYNFYYGSQTVANKLKLANATQYAQLRNQAVTNDGGTAPFANPSQFGTGTNWQDQIFGTAPMMSHNLSVSGGTETSNYFTSVAYLHQKGIVATDQSDYKRMNFRVNTSFQPKKYIKFGENFNYSYTRSTTFFNTNYWSSGPLNDAINLDPITSAVVTDINSQPNAAIYNSNAAYLLRNAQGLPYGISNYAPLLNPLAEVKLFDGNYNWSHSLFGDVYAELSPIKGLSIKTEIAAKQAFYGTESFRPIYYLTPTNSNLGQNSQSRSSNQNLEWNWDNTATYTRLIGKHNFTVLAGTSAEQESGGSVGTTYYGEPISTYQQASFNFNLPQSQRFGYAGDSQPITHSSYFSRVTYDYDQKYLIQAGFRRDGSSKFGPGHIYGNFPSISAGWVVTKENWFPKNTFIDYLKIRASYGVLGNELALAPFQYSPIVSGIGSYVFGPAGSQTLVTGYGPQTLANPNLQWERDKSIDLAIDMTMFQDLTITLDYYKKVSDQLLMQVPLPSYVGVSSAPYSNAGGITNKGIELQLGYNHKFGDFALKLNGNISYNKNTVTNLNVLPFINTGDWHSANPSTIQRISVGQPLNYFYGYNVLGIFQSQAQVDAYKDASGNLLQPNAKPGDLIYASTTGAGPIGPSDRQNLGSPIPTWQYGFNFVVNYKQFDLNVFGQGVWGNKIFQQYRRLDVTAANYPIAALNAWTPSNANTNYPRLTDSDPNGNYHVPSSFDLQSGAYLRVKTLQLGYTLPKSLTSKWDVNRVHIYIGGDNLFTVTKYNGYDPEISGGVDQGVYPKARTIRFGLDVAL